MQQEAQQVSSCITKHTSLSISTGYQQAGCWGEGGNQRQMNTWTDPRWALLLSYMGRHCLDTSSINHHLHRTHVPLMETQHSGFYSICTKEGETRADLVPNSTVNTRCFFPLAISDQNFIFGTHITTHSWLTYLSKYTHHDSLCSFPVFIPLCIEQKLVVGREGTETKSQTWKKTV